MPEVVVIEFDAPDAIETCRSVSRELGVDPETASGDRPAPLRGAVAGACNDKLIVVEIRDSQADQERLMERLGAALTAANAPPPTSVKWCARAGAMHRG